MKESMQGRAGLAPLLVIATAQLMLVLDDSIVNIALPSIQAELKVQPVHLPWMVNAYILAFGALLLLGGRIGDLWGRKRTLQVGIAIFIVASLVGGLGQTPRCSSSPAPSRESARQWPHRTRDYSPLATSMSGLPFAAGIILGAGIAPKLLLKVAPRSIAILGRPGRSGSPGSPSIRATGPASPLRYS